jgi:hypothetical protein
MRNISGDEIAGIIEEAVSRPDLWKTTIKNAYAKSTDFTYEKYLQRVKKEIIL